jgi:hypothetical protein
MSVARVLRNGQQEVSKMNTLRFGDVSVQARGEELFFETVESQKKYSGEDPDVLLPRSRFLTSYLASLSNPATSFGIDLGQLKRDIFSRLCEFVENEGHQSAVTAIELCINTSEEKTQESLHGQSASVGIRVTCNTCSKALPDVVIRRETTIAPAARHCTAVGHSEEYPPAAEMADLYHRLEALWLRRELGCSWFGEQAGSPLCAV